MVEPTEKKTTLTLVPAADVRATRSASAESWFGSKAKLWFASRLILKGRKGEHDHHSPDRGLSQPEEQRRHCQVPVDRLQRHVEADGEHDCRKGAEQAEEHADPGSVRRILTVASVAGVLRLLSASASAERERHP